MLTSDEHIKKIQEKKDEDENRKKEIEKRKKEREERKEAKNLKKSTSTKKGKKSMQTTPDTETTPDTPTTPEPPKPVVDLDVCKMCKCVEPESGEDDVAWIECDTCECWYHVVCVGIDETDLGETYFVCEDCCSV